MNKSDNQEVQKLLDGMFLSNRNYFNIIQDLRGIVLCEFPKASERVMYGGIMFNLKRRLRWNIQQ